ncbi:hypothetical protein GO491_09865 [Flavobacteriaceae bacterium Ap0902]|nr:hypothetical protein [Flavobacteriaceae bacterium Ap0902]
MKLSELKNHLNNLDQITFKLPSGTMVEPHFHITEVGQTQKKYIDCGGTLRDEKMISLQLWSANDYEHRLNPQKFLDIINLSQGQLNLEDAEIEVEYQGDTIETYDIDFDGINFLLKSKFTDCLAPDKCGIPTEKPKIKLSNLNKDSACTPSSGCC